MLNVTTRAKQFMRQDAFALMAPVFEPALHAGNSMSNAGHNAAVAGHSGAQHTQDCLGNHNTV